MRKRTSRFIEVDNVENWIKVLEFDELWEARHNSSYGDKILWEVPFNCDHEVVFF